MTNEKLNGIHINTEVPEIPIVIGKLNFSFSLSDANISNFQKQGEDIKKRLEAIADVEYDDDDEALEKAKEVLTIGYDAILGDGAFEKLYEQTGSIIYLMEYFTQLVNGLNRVLGERGLMSEGTNRYQRRAAEKKKNKKNK